MKMDFLKDIKVLLSLRRHEQKRSFVLFPPEFEPNTAGAEYRRGYEIPAAFLCHSCPLISILLHACSTINNTTSHIMRLGEWTPSSIVYI